jgi:hypothetical protein
MRHGQDVRLAALTIGTVLLFGACGDESNLVAPRAPTPLLRPAEYGARTFSTPQELFALGRFLPLEEDVVVSHTISPSGGTIVVREAGIALRFPAGAVESSTRITIRAHAGDRAAYTFEPHGLQFAVPVEVGQFLLSTNPFEVGSELHGAYLPDGIEDVDASGSATVSEVYPIRFQSFGVSDDRFVVGFATFRIAHFSGYMLASSSYNTGSTLTTSSGYMLASGKSDTTSKSR